MDGEERASGLRAADGVAFTHELSAIEVASGLLSADDDLALWAQFAVGGLSLAAGGEVGATTVLDLPPGIGDDLPAGQGMIGQLLTGPDGWLAGFSAGDLLSVRLRDGALEISAGTPPKQDPGTGRVRDACAFAAVEALKRYAQGTADHPSAPLDEILLDLLSTEPKIFASPLPPLARTLHAAGDRGGPMSDHGDLRKFLAGQSPAWLADRLVRAAGRDRVLLAELQSAASGTDAVETARRELDHAIFVSGFVDEEEVGTYVAGVDRALDMLAGLIDSGHAAQAAGLAEHALQLMHESAESVNYEYELAECAGFAQELHRRACLAADADRRALAEWLFDAVSKDDYGLFQSAVADYTQVLGEPGMERLRELIDAAMATGVRYPLLQMAEQAVRPLGVDAVVDVLAKDLRGSRQYTRICQELISAGRDEQALEWARRGLKERGNERDHGLSELRVITVSLCGRLGKTTEAVELAWEEFAASPSLEAYQRLCEHAVIEGTWPSWRERALATLRAQPRIGEVSPVPNGYRPPGHSTLIHVLLWEGNEEAAWRAAQQGGCADGLWLELARRRASTHPADAATVLRQQIEAVTLTKRDGYDRALSLLSELRACHERMGTLDQFDDYLTRLRDANSRKHSFTARLKTAWQPR